MRLKAFNRGNRIHLKEVGEEDATSGAEAEESVDRDDDSVASRLCLPNESLNDVDT